MTRPLPSTIAHLDALTATGGEGRIVISTPMPELPKKPWASWCFAIDEVDAAAQCCADLDAQGRNVFVRTNLIGEPLPVNGPGWSWKRGWGADTRSVVALAVDLDVAGPGHKPGAAKLPLPPDLATAKSILRDLPKPSLEIDTGGGEHDWWILEEPEFDDPIGLTETWADGIVEAGRLRGWHVDRPDAARVLRPCGTYRRKLGLEPNLVTLHDVAGWPADGLSVRPWCPTGRYGATELLEALPRPKPPPPPPPPARPRRPGEVGPLNAVFRLSWEQILKPLDWTFEGMGSVEGKPVELWRRDGASSEFSVKCFADGTAVAWSDACGLPAGKGQRLNKWKIYYLLHHDGDESGAARAIRLRAREMAR